MRPALALALAFAVGLGLGIAGASSNNVAAGAGGALAVLMVGAFVLLPALLIWIVLFLIRRIRGEWSSLRST